MKKSNLCGVLGAIALITPILLNFGWLTLLSWLLAIFFFSLAYDYKEQEKRKALRDSYINGRYNK
jgi:hypothetical protein